MFDLVLQGGSIIDGTRRPRFLGDLGIQQDRIAAVGDLRQAEARQVIDVTGQVVAPGFIDVHNHTDGWMLKQPDLDVKVRQGFTTEVLMSDGISYAPVDEFTAYQWHYYLRCLNGLRLDEYGGWQTIADYHALLDRNCLQNSLTQVPYANVRTLIRGFGNGAVDDLQRKGIQAEIRKGMEQGATGLSTGMDYLNQWYATTDELVDAVSAIREFNGLFVTHIRYKHGLMPGLMEAVEIGRRAGVKVHISHLKPLEEGDPDRLLTYIDQVARHEVDFSFEVYPYQPGSTMAHFMLPYEVWDEGPMAVPAKLHRPEVLARIRRSIENYRVALDGIRIGWVQSVENKRWQGATLAEYIAAKKQPIELAMVNLLIEERMAVLLVFGEQDDRLMRPMMQHDLGMIGSDGIYFPDGMVHPRVTGTAPRVLGRAVRDWNLLSLEDAVYRLSGFPARRFGAIDRGEIAERKFADLVVFNPETVMDNSHYSAPHEAPDGISLVLVNGQTVWAPHVQPTFERGKYPGRSLVYSPADAWQR